MIFAREVSDSLTGLVKKIDTATAEHKGCRMGSFVVFCTDDDKLEKQLKELAKKEELKKTVLTIDNPQGPHGYNVAKDADVTVVLYVNREVKSNYAFKKGELHEKDIDTIVADVSKILPKKDKDDKKNDKDK
jgi:hypothetical protein